MRFLIPALLALSAAPASAAAPPPKLLIMISVDQLSADLFAQYRRHFTGGLARLQEGAVFPSGYQSHAASETCPGHATLLTGSRPARTGIIANSWIDPAAPRADKNIYCAEDESVAGSTSLRYTPSAIHLRGRVLGDRLRASGGGRTLVVAGKDRSAIMMGGANADAIFWWGSAGFATYAGHAAPPAVAEANRAADAVIARPAAARPLPTLCRARDRAVPLDGAGGVTVGSGRLVSTAGDRSLYRATPGFDAAVIALADALRREMRLGRGEGSDLLALGLAASDYVGHAFGTQGAEMCIQLLALDALLGEFFARLDAEGIDYAVALSADHGGLDAPERAREQGATAAARVDPALAPAAMGAAIAGRLGLAAPVLVGEAPFGDIYLAPAVSRRRRDRVLRAAVAAYRAHPQVAAAFTRAELAAAPAPAPSASPEAWSLLDRAKASFDPARSGDLVVLLKPGIMPIAVPSRGYSATHGSAWSYDRRVPVLFWRKGMAGFEQPLPVETVDIMPTLAALAGVRVDPAEIDGRCLDLDAGPGDTCAAR